MPTRNAHRRPGLPGAQSAPTKPNPIQTVPDKEWQKQLDQANRACRLIDLHLDHEARGRLLEKRDDFQPEHLCPEQRIQLVSDLYGTTK